VCYASVHNKYKYELRDTFLNENFLLKLQHMFKYFIAKENKI